MCSMGAWPMLCQPTAHLIIVCTESWRELRRVVWNKSINCWFRKWSSEGLRLKPIDVLGRLQVLLKLLTIVWSTWLTNPNFKKSTVPGLMLVQATNTYAMSKLSYTLVHIDSRRHELYDRNRLTWRIIEYTGVHQPHSSLNILTQSSPVKREKND